jgi:4-hydroxybenzoyl-CoA thioesterase
MSITKMYKIKVEWGDCDPYGIVFYPNFYKWMDSAQWNYFNKIKQPITRLEKLYGIVGLPLLHTEATYIAACYREDILIVETALVKLTKSTLKLEHVIKRKDKVVCYGYETRIWAKNIDGKIVSEHIPREIRTVFYQYLSNETTK